jgi:aspartyl-tRNA(Asn)/glutamyl-tRNA(Gln) amidotransferase subunit C
MAIDQSTVRHVARLARLALSPEEEERTAAQLGHVLEYIERLKSVDVEGVEPLSFAGDPAEAQASMRADDPGSCLSREKVLSQAPEQDGSSFLVPRIIE